MESNIINPEFDFSKVKLSESSKFHQKRRSESEVSMTSSKKFSAVHLQVESFRLILSRKWAENTYAAFCSMATVIQYFMPESEIWRCVLFKIS